MKVEDITGPRKFSVEMSEEELLILHTLIGNCAPATLQQGGQDWKEVNEVLRGMWEALVKATGHESTSITLYISRDR